MSQPQRAACGTACLTLTSGLPSTGDEGYDQHDDDQYAVAEAILEAASAEPGLPARFVAGLVGHACALSETLRAMTVAATYSCNARSALKAIWPAVMTVILDAADAGASVFDDLSWGDQALAELVPRSSHATADGNPMAAISAARDG